MTRTQQQLILLMVLPLQPPLWQTLNRNHWKAIKNEKGGIILYRITYFLNYRSDKWTEKRCETLSYCVFKWSPRAGKCHIVLRSALLLLYLAFRANRTLLSVTSCKIFTYSTCSSSAELTSVSVHINLRPALLCFAHHSWHLENYSYFLDEITMVKSTQRSQEKTGSTSVWTWHQSHVCLLQTCLACQTILWTCNTFASFFFFFCPTRGITL